MTELQRKLEEINSCPEAIEWVGDRTLSEAWEECVRGDWMLWFVGKLDLDRKRLTLAACECARLVLHLVPEDEKRQREAIKLAEKALTSTPWTESAQAAKEEAQAAAAEAWWDVVEAAWWDADDAEHSKTLKTCADIARKHFTLEEVERAMKKKF